MEGLLTYFADLSVANKLFNTRPQRRGRLCSSTEGHFKLLFVIQPFEGTTMGRIIVTTAGPRRVRDKRTNRPRTTLAFAGARRGHPSQSSSSALPCSCSSRRCTAVTQILVHENTTSKRCENARTSCSVLYYDVRYVVMLYLCVCVCHNSNKPSLYPDTHVRTQPTHRDSVLLPWSQATRNTKRRGHAPCSVVDTTCSLPCRSCCGAPTTDAAAELGLWIQTAT